MTRQELIDRRGGTTTRYRTGWHPRVRVNMMQRGIIAHSAAAASRTRPSAGMPINPARRVW
jgi:hypothetical protein